MGTVTSFRGRPCITFSDEETEWLAERLKFAIIGKFSHGLPSLSFLKNRLIKLDLRGSVSVGAINLKHVLIQLSHEEDCYRLWLRGEWLFDNYRMRVFKWSPTFNSHIESPIAPVWIKFPELPCHLLEKNALFGIASLIGKPFRMDEPLADLSRPSMARVCVELDLTAPRIPAIFLEVDDLTIRQSVIYENCPLYCSQCKHLETTCLNKSRGEQVKSTLPAKTTEVIPTAGGSNSNNRPPDITRRQTLPNDPMECEELEERETEADTNLENGKAYQGAPPKSKSLPIEASNPGPAGAGGLLRNHFGRIIFAFQEPLGTSSIVEAELKAIFRGLQICKDKGLHKIWIEVDALNVIKILENPCQGARNLQHLLQKTRTLMRSLETKISHIYQEGNQAADFFANQACLAEALTILGPEQIADAEMHALSVYLAQWQEIFDTPNCLCHLKQSTRSGQACFKCKEIVLLVYNFS
ncbi:UNVERIFIED_CONTAM: hypothetical protein Slati_3337900 [Sesamum latifolium]|uniref:RNase H type-1 domain-containing protein n=1 Tax=Sesamum latifolium TaxID=2727402 RepID=A0AAW2UCN8_9LAMI